MFSKDPEKYITSASLRYVRYEGTDTKVGAEHNVVKDVRFENNIPWIIGKIKEFLQATLKDYYFLTLRKFNNRINKDAFAEWEEVYPGKFYGTLKSEIENEVKIDKQKEIIVDRNNR